MTVTPHPAAAGRPGRFPAAAAWSPRPGRDWQGRDANALRRALGMSRSRFARTLHLPHQTVSKWTSRPETIPGPRAQDALDALLAGAAPAVRERFGQLAAPKPPAAPEAVPLQAKVCLYGDSDQEWDPKELESFLAMASTRDAR